MLAIWGFATIVVFLLLITTKRLSVISALVMVPILFAFFAGFSYTEIGSMALAGIKQVAPTGVLLMFAVLYFSVMLDAGLFDPVITFIVRSVKGDPLKVIVGTAILTMIVHLDGDGTATFMIVLSAFLTIYKRLGISRLMLAGIVALSVGPMHMVPWSGTSVRAISTLNSDAVHMFNPNIPAMLSGIVWVLFVAFIFGRRERKRLGIIQFDYNHLENITGEQKALRRPKLTIINAILTISLIISLLKGVLPAPVLFVIASIFALMINYNRLSDQQKIMKSHGANIFLVSSMIFAAGVYSGILTESKMVAAMASELVNLIPKEHASLIPVLTAITSMPASMLFTPDAYYYGVVPVLGQTCVQFGIDPLEVGRASLLGQMTVGFPLSPLTASTFLLVGLAEIELGDHQKFVFKWAWGTTIVMTVVSILTGSIHL
jgi:citrate-Mg2+:H+ or citrate-Ca2+:H+ symporter, CitMHS family